MILDNMPIFRHSNLSYSMQKKPSDKQFGSAYLTATQQVDYCVH